MLGEHKSERSDWRTSLLIRYLPQPADDVLRRWCYPAMLLARDRVVPLTRMRGATRTGQASVLVAGPDPWAFELARRFFRGCPQESASGTAPVWKLDSTLERMAPTVDLVMARVDRFSARLFFPQRYLRVPEWIDTQLAVPRDLAALARSNHSLREDMRVVRHNQLEAGISHREDDFDTFYRSMYVPFIRARHGAHAWPSHRESLLKCFRRGGLIWLTQAGTRIAAILFERAGRTLHLPAEGTRGGDPGILKNGVVSALFYHAIQHAIELNCEVVDFGGCRACLSDGVLRYKRKWGMEARARRLNQFYTLVGWSTWNTAVATFLSDVPVLHQEKNRLTAVTAAHLPAPAREEDARKICQSISMPGIDRVLIVNAEGWMPGTEGPPGSVLMGGDPRPDRLVQA